MVQIKRQKDRSTGRQTCKERNGKKLAKLTSTQKVEDARVR